MMKDIKAQAFADALTELCKKHGVMIWTATPTAPIMVSDAAPADAFYYLVGPREIGNSITIHRVLGDKT